MPRRDLRVRRGFSRRRQMVRIVKPHRVTRSAALGLLVVGIAAAVLFLTWRYWQVNEDVPTRSYSLADRVLDWKCESGHVFEDRGRSKSRLCPTCSEEAYLFGEYSCPVDGAFEVAVRHSTDEGGVVHVSEYRFAGDDWISAKDKLHCPKCDRKLERRPTDPFARKRRGGRRGGG